jgi:hypothetical protein
MMTAEVTARFPRGNSDDERSPEGGSEERCSEDFPMDGKILSGPAGELRRHLGQP